MAGQAIPLLFAGIFVYLCRPLRARVRGYGFCSKKARSRIGNRLKNMMKKSRFLLVALGFCLACALSFAQEEPAVEAPKVITLEQALQIALDQNVSVKVADMEIEKSGYARKGAYAALFPTIDGSGAYQRTIKKQVMYMDFDLGSMGMGGGEGAEGAASKASGAGQTSGGGIEVGRWNTWSAGVTAAMPLVNAQLWKSLRISDQDVELSVEKARSSRLDMVTQVKEAYFAVLLAKQVFEVYKSVYENAVDNLNQIQKKYNAQKASELDLTRAKTTLANAIPNVYDSENSVILSLWQLKAVMGVDLGENIDVDGILDNYSEHMFYDLHVNDDFSLDRNSTMRQLAIQAEELANNVKLQQYANIPSLALAFNYSINAMTNDFNFSEYNWSPYSYVGLSLSIPIFAGGKRSNAIKQAKVQAAEINLQRADTERQLRIAIRQYLGTMDTAVNSYASAESAVETARKAFSIAQKSYNVGRSTLTDLNDAQLALVEAELGSAQAIYSFVVAKAELEKLLGADFIDETGNIQLNNTYEKYIQ